MSDRDPKPTRLPKCNLLERTIALAREKGLTFGEARRELALRGASAKARKNLRIKNHGQLLQRKGLS